MDQAAVYSRGFNPPETTRLWRDRILPRLIVPLYWLYWIGLLPARAIGARARLRNRGRSPVIAIESGIVGWTHVYFEELFGSAGDHFGTNNICKQSIDRELPYFPQFKLNQVRDCPTVVVLDVRTPGQSWSRSLIEAFRVSWYLTVHGITPIVVLTDAFYRRHRWQSAVLTVYRGGVVTFANTTIVRKIFPHSRIQGPLFMPVSQATLEKLRVEKKKFIDAQTADTPLVIQFIGSMYPPREQFLEVVREQLQVAGIELRINGDKSGTSNADYWRILVQSDIVLTTTLQGPSRNIMDWIWVRQAVFRYAETMAAGTALVAQQVDGGFPLVTGGHDFLEFDGVDQAIEAVTLLVQDAKLRQKIAQQGNSTISQYVVGSQFWLSVARFF